MRPAIRRSLKYNKKLDPNVVENRVEALKTKQLSNYNVSMAKQMQLDTWIKSLGLGMNEVYYIIFAKQIDKLIGKYKSDILGEEVAGKKDLWVTRGLSSDTLDDIITRFNITPPTPPPACADYSNQTDCEGNGCYWYNNGCHSTPATCIDYNNQTECESNGCYWYDGSCHSEASDWLGNYNYRREVTVNNGGGVLSNFQIKIELSSTNFDFTHAESDGRDIRITKADKLNKLPYWIESWDSAGQTAKVWVEAESLIGAGDTSLYLYYGDNTVSSETDFDNTFTKDYGESGLKGLWHMDDGVSPTADSSGNGNDGTVNGATWVGSDGGQWDSRSDVNFSTGNSLSFDGIDDYVEVPDSNELDIFDSDYFTISFWVYKNSDTDWSVIISKAHDTGYNRWMVQKNSGTDSAFTLFIADINSSGNFGSTGAVTDNKWHHIIFTGHINDVISSYVDGQCVNNNESLSGITNFNSADKLAIGARNNGGYQEFFNGIIDEVRIYNRALSLDEIKAHYERRKYASPEPTNGVGSEESKP